jgi:hypothetical protein
MRSYLAVLFLAICYAGAVQADVPVPGNDFGQAWMVTQCDLPSEAEVLRALPVRPRDNIQIVMERIRQKAGPVRFYPVVGLSRLVQTSWRCTVYSDKRVEVVHLDRSHLEPIKK